MSPYCYNGGWFHPLWFLVGFVIFMLIVTRFSWWGRFRHAYGDRTPLEYLKTRYAKGEITQTEYERLKTELKQ